MDNSFNPHTRTLSVLLETVDAVQYVNKPTHDGNHILDLVITKHYCITDLSVVNQLLSDHRAITFTVEKAPMMSKKTEALVKRRC